MPPKWIGPFVAHQTTFIWHFIVSPPTSHFDLTPQAAVASLFTYRIRWPFTSGRHQVSYIQNTTPTRILVQLVDCGSPLSSTQFVLAWWFMNDQLTTRPPRLYIYRPNDCLYKVHSGPESEAPNRCNTEWPWVKDWPLQCSLSINAL